MKKIMMQVFKYLTFIGFIALLVHIVFVHGVDASLKSFACTAFALAFIGLDNELYDSKKNKEEDYENDESEEEC